MNIRNEPHAERVLDHLARSASAQWPIGTAPAIVDAAVQTKKQHGELLTMVRRLSFALHSVSLIGGSDARRTALCTEADALVRRCGGGK